MMDDLFGNFYVVGDRVCPNCGERTACGHYFTGDNRNHMLCLDCGISYVSIHGDEMDDIEEIGGFMYINSIPIKGKFLECRT